MARIAYLRDRFSPAHMDIIQKVNQICADYQAQGFNLTLRQVYYQFVSRGWLANKDTEYKRLGGIITRGRRAGEIDWGYIEDRTRNVRGGDGNMTDPSQTISEWAFYAAMWQGQPNRVEVWVEKDALVDIVGRAAGGLRTAYFSCRGYTSDSEIHVAAERIEGYLETEGVEKVTILHLGDHDPSGIDMSRDITDRLSMFLAGDGYGAVEFMEDDEEPVTGKAVRVRRIALNMHQIDQYGPPPNPAKITDSRATGYIDRFGESSWELDALEPSVLRDLIQENIQSEIVDEDAWADRISFEQDQRGTLRSIKKHYTDVIAFLREQGKLEKVEEPE